MSWVTPPNMDLTEHFRSVEAVCKHCGQVPSIRIIQETADWLEIVRAALGGYVMHITSWCRCVPHNMAVGGAPNSYHIKGMAVDFVLRGLSLTETKRRVKALQRAGTVGGVGTYSSWCHIDLGPRRNWNGP